MARLYLDEDIPASVGPALAQLSHDTVHAYDLGNRSVPDPEHLLIAARAGRILVTFNRRDFGELHQLWTALNAWGIFDQPHAGILSSWGQISADDWTNLVHSFISQRQSLDNQMWEWQHQQQDWNRFGW